MEKVECLGEVCVCLFGEGCLFFWLVDWGFFLICFSLCCLDFFPGMHAPSQDLYVAVLPKAGCWCAVSVEGAVGAAPCWGAACHFWGLPALRRGCSCCYWLGCAGARVGGNTTACFGKSNHSLPCVPEDFLPNLGVKYWKTSALYQSVS